jgi:hypothetical protein
VRAAEEEISEEQLSAEMGPGDMDSQLQQAEEAYGACNTCSTGECSGGLMGQLCGGRNVQLIAGAEYIYAQATFSDAVAFVESPDLVKTMDLVRSFSFDHGLLGEGAKSKDVVGIGFAGGKTLGDEKNVKLIGVEAAGEGLDGVKHAASLTKGYPGVLHGNRTYLLQDENGQIIETHSVSAGLDYPGVGPEHAYLKDIGRAEYVSITDEEALKAFHDCCHIEGIIPALESSHALAYAVKLAATLPKDQIILANLSGRGDKDMHTVAERMGLNFS